MPEQPPIERGFFREAEDGTSVFFPWGLTHRGYRLTHPGARKQASRSVSILVSSTIAIGTWTAYRLQPFLDSGKDGATEILRALAALGGAPLLALLFYWLWVWRFVEGHAESDLRVSREERLREAANLAGPGKVALIGVLVCGLSVLLIWLQPHAWWLGLLGVALGAQSPGTADPLPPPYPHSVTRGLGHGADRERIAAPPTSHTGRARVKWVLSRKSVAG